MAANMYMKFENPDIIVPGEPGHEGEIPILSWSHGFVQPTSSTRSVTSETVEQAAHQNLTFTKYLDEASTALLKFCWGGKQIAKVTLRCYRFDGNRNPIEYLTVIMEHVVISNYSISAGPGDLPVENISLDYGIIQYNYMQQKHTDESPSAKHDLRTHTIE